MKTISISQLQLSIKSGKKAFTSILLEGDLLNWDVLEDFDSKRKSMLILEVADESNSLNILIGSTSSKYSPSDYFIAFAHTGIKIKLIGNFKVPSITNSRLNANLQTITMSTASKVADIEIRGCPSYKKWRLKNSSPAARSNPTLSTAAELFKDQAKKKPKEKKHSNTYMKSIDGIKRFRSQMKNTAGEFQHNIIDNDLRTSSFDYEIPKNFPSKNFEWFFTEKGMKLFSFPIKDSFFHSSIDYKRPRLSFVFQFNPPDRGMVALYWMGSKLKWIRIGEIRAENNNDYVILKHFINGIETIDELQSKLNLKHVSNMKKLPEFDIE
jgi:hypothetical protein